MPDVGLNQNSKQIVLSEVEVIFHCAATVRFNDPLRRSTELNVRSIRDLIAMAKQMKQLKVCLKIKI